MNEEVKIAFIISADEPSHYKWMFRDLGLCILVKTSDNRYEIYDMVSKVMLNHYKDFESAMIEVMNISAERKQRK